MYIKDRKKIEKALAGLLNEMIAQGMIDENKKETIEQLEAAREYELRQICEEIETLFLITSLEYAFLSSTIVKEIASFGKDVSSWVPKAVEDKLKEKFKCSLL